ncbi:MAG: hypothetical protein VX944_04940 [Myxococcota bacterium]|nr:hypothetical protein [Myxococcota bacterium]
MASHWTPLKLVLALTLVASGCSETGVSKTGAVGASPGDDDAPFSTDWGQWLAMTSYEGKPAITFYDRAQGGLGFAIGTVTESSVEWAFEGVDGYPDSSGLDLGDRGTYGSLAVDAAGFVWAAYYDQGAKTLRYAKRHPRLKAWKTGIADVGDGVSPDAGRFSSIAIAADGNPVIAHHDHGAGTLRKARWNGTGFVGSVFDAGDPVAASDTGSEEPETAPNVGQFVKLKIIGGVEYMAYYDAANGDLKLAIGDTVHVVDDAGDVGKWPDFAVVGDTIHIVYQDAGLQQLKYATGAPGAWDISVVDTAPYTGADTALYVEAGAPKVVYFQGRENDMKHATLADGAWSSRMLLTEGAVGFHNEVIQLDGQSYVGCYDYTSRSVRFAKLD